MENTSLLTASQLFSVLEDVPVAVCVSSVEEHRLLYANRLARETFLEEKNAQPSCCYHAAGFQKECSFCPKRETGKQGNFVREHEHPRNGRIYELRGQVTDWNGQCVYIEYLTDITEKKRAEEDMNEKLQGIVNAIPGGVASYRMEAGNLVATFCSDGVLQLFGYTKEELLQISKMDVLNTVYELDRKRIRTAVEEALHSGEVLDAYFRVLRKNGNLVWIHVNGRRIAPLAENAQFYCTFTEVSAETQLFQNLTEDTEGAIYVIDKESYELLYVNEAEKYYDKHKNYHGKKCYTVLHGKKKPCEFCTLQTKNADNQEHIMKINGTDRIFTTRFREIDWNGVPAYAKYVRDTTEESRLRREKERIEQYFETVIQNLSGGVAVICMRQDGSSVPEYMSRGFAELLGMTLEEAWDVYRDDASAGVLPEDWKQMEQQIRQYLKEGVGHFSLEYRIRKKDGSYIWVRPNFSVLYSTQGEIRLYAVYQDMSGEIEEQERQRQQYKEMIFRHYQKPGQNALIIGHCNITQNKILEIIDHTDSDLLETFGSVREEFFTGMSELIVDDDEKAAFLSAYLGKPALEAFLKNRTEQVQECFVKFPKEELGRYVQIKMTMVDTPDTGDITGILTVTDITEKVISDKVLHHLSVAGYDFVASVDLLKDTYQLISVNKNATSLPPVKGCHSKWREHVYTDKVVPRDQKAFRQGLDTESIVERLRTEGVYSFVFSMLDEDGEVRTKNMTVSEIDLRLGRVCLSRMDITEAVREQQGMLHMLAYTFELAGFINAQSRHFTMYTRESVLDNLAPYVAEDYRRALCRLTDSYGETSVRREIEEELDLGRMISRLKEAPSGYDFVLPYQTEEGLRYKQINVLWGDQNHQTVCFVRMDVTDMLAKEKKTQNALEKALKETREANRAKNDFLSSMSHDIRTPLNAIIGMTTLATAHENDRERVRDCLDKIATSSRHLLSLVNDILDVNKLESAGVKISRMLVSLPELLEQLSAIMLPQAKDAKLKLELKTEGVTHKYFYGDILRINQIFINILGNAIKFTPENGSVNFLVQEMPSEKSGYVRYRFTVRDTGIGMPEDFLAHIFEPFSRSGNATQIEGTGLGLNIVKRLVELLGGKIQVSSTLGEGTTFVVELEEELAAGKGNPWQKETEGSAHKTVLKNRRVLIAEDNEINAEITCGLLELFEMEAVVKKDGAQAVQEFRDAPPGTYDAILMDIRMPVMNGYEATKEIRRMDREDASKIPVIAMTANAFMEDIKASMEAGMDYHVSKPIDVEMLRITLENALGQRESGR